MRIKKRVVAHVGLPDLRGCYGTRKQRSKPFGSFTHVCVRAKYYGAGLCFFSVRLCKALGSSPLEESFTFLFVFKLSYDVGTIHKCCGPL